MVNKSIKPSDAASERARSIAIPANSHSWATRIVLILLIGVVAIGAGVAVSSFDLPGIGLFTMVVVAAVALGWSITPERMREDESEPGSASIAGATTGVAKPQAAQVLDYATLKPKATRLPFWAHTRLPYWVQMLIGFLYVLVAGFLTLGLIPSEGLGFGIGLMVTAGPAALLPLGLCGFGGPVGRH